MTEPTVYGIKFLNPNLTTRGFQYEPGVLTPKIPNPDACPFRMSFGHGHRLGLSTYTEWSTGGSDPSKPASKASTVNQTCPVKGCPRIAARSPAKTAQPATGSGAYALLTANRPVRRRCREAVTVARPSSRASRFQKKSRYWPPGRRLWRPWTSSNRISSSVHVVAGWP